MQTQAHFTLPFAKRTYLLLATGILLCLLIAGCGFKMRGPTPLPFTTLYTNIPQNSAFGARVWRAIQANSPGTTVTEDAALAEAKLIQEGFNRSRREVSLDAQGKVEEYELNLTLTFTMTDSRGNELIPTSRISATRQLPYDEDDSAAKQEEMALMYEDMEKSIADRLIRRITAPDVITSYLEHNPTPGFVPAQ
ncbi:MAG: LPS assembly lipoprotein LptE [Advenella sp.]|nr:LPS assembly lipoprotein LptE [Advenella sp.]